MNQKKKRIFIALSMPQADVYLSEIRKSNIKSKLRLVSAENLHLTLIFLGELPMTKVLWLQKELYSIQFTSYSLISQELGFFYQKNIAKVMWLSFQKSAELIYMHQRAHEIIIAAGISMENESKENRKKKEFSPHCTLARSAFLTKAEAMTELREIECPKVIIQIDSFYLMQSTLLAQGPKYQILAKYSCK